MAYFSSCSTGDAGDEEGMREIFGPGQVDQTIRQAIQICWMALPKDKRNVEEVERQIRRLVERALKDLREDGEAFRRIDAQQGAARPGRNSGTPNLGERNDDRAGGPSIRPTAGPS